MVEEKLSQGEGAGAAALVSAGMGCLVLGVLTAVADHSPKVKAAMIWVKPTGPLSGVTTAAFIVWLVSWAALHVAWKSKAVNARTMGWVALGLLLLGMLLVFPPVVDLL